MKRRLADWLSILQADRRKTGTLIVLVLALLAIGLRGVFSLGPESSSASDDNDAIESPAQVGQSALSRTLELLNQMQSGQFTEIPRSPRLSRDLFAVDSRVFPPPKLAVPIEQPKPERIEPEVESHVEDADEIRAREIALIHADANDLRLRSVMVGQNPLAVFESMGGQRSVVPLNGSISGFEVIEVTTEWVVVEKDAVRVRLWLAVPQR